MLIKQILSTYGKCLSGKGTPDPYDRSFASLSARGKDLGDIKSIRSNVQEALLECRPFFLDFNAANFVDSFVSGMKGSKFLSETKLPADVIWIEYDAVALAHAQHETGRRDLNPDVDMMDLRGVLVDNRSDDELIVRMFSRNAEGFLVDPTGVLSVEKFEDGTPNSDRSRFITSDYMADVLGLMPHVTQEDYTEILQETRQTTGYLCILAFATVALINSKSDDIEFGEKDIFSSKEQRTARKFGKTHISDAPKFLTVHLTEPGKRYVDQLRDDAEERKRVASGGTPKVRHEVREHIRRYKSGLVVTVRSHKRGSEPDRRPTRVTAPEKYDRPREEDTPNSP